MWQWFLILLMSIQSNAAIADVAKYVSDNNISVSDGIRHHDAAGIILAVLHANPCSADDKNATLSQTRMRTQVKSFVGSLAASSPTSEFMCRAEDFHVVLNHFCHLELVKSDTD